MILIAGGGKSSEIAAEEIIHQGEVPLRLVLPEETFSPLEGVETVKGRLLSFTGRETFWLRLRLILKLKNSMSVLQSLPSTRLPRLLIPTALHYLQF